MFSIDIAVSFIMKPEGVRLVTGSIVRKLFCSEGSLKAVYDVDHSHKIYVNGFYHMIL